MSESERRRKYRYNRVLIETARILDPQFDDAVVYLTGAQIEMLRNVTQYLNRLDTYVSEQFLGYYLAPTVEDYDSILAIVADLEEVLMGNNNVIFGYREIREDTRAETVAGSGDKTKWMGSVPAGDLYRIESATACNFDTACTKIHIVAAWGAHEAIIAEDLSPVAGRTLFFDGMLTLDEDAGMYAKFFDCADGDYIKFDVRGYTMDVP